MERKVEMIAVTIVVMVLATIVVMVSSSVFKIKRTTLDAHHSYGLEQMLTPSLSDIVGHILG